MKELKPWEAELNKILEIPNPREALLKIYRQISSENLSLTVAEETIDRYLKRYDIEMEDMTFFPNGNKVISQDVHWALSGDDFKEKTIQEILDKEGFFEY